jgi:hypothetical protein
MDNFRILSFDPETTEFTATGFVSCFKTNDEWAIGDFRIEASAGGNYANNIVFASRYIHFSNLIVFPTAGQSAITYVSGKPVVFTLRADTWVNTTYTLDLTAYGAIDDSKLQIGIPPTSSIRNATLLTRYALTMPNAIYDVDSNTNEVTSASATIIAIEPPIEDIDVAIWGLT